MNDPISAQFVRKSLIKHSGEDANNLKRAIGNSKIITAPHYKTMPENEIKRDVSKFNIWRNANQKNMVSPHEVIATARQLQQDLMQAEARKKEAAFRKAEEEREKTMGRNGKVKLGNNDFEDNLRQKREQESKKIDEIHKKNIKERIKEEIKDEVQDMAID